MSGLDSCIRVLSPEVANKIAAGEVVERPASVLKELLENALDAGATQVDVELAGGGVKLLAVRDNGRGMIKDDAILSVERHATSKIKDVDDIEGVKTLGFRGEALAAISSVSRFTLTTCRTGSPAGTRLRMSGGKLQDVADAGCPAGTSVEVRDLFFNVPARRKFLRSLPTEWANVRTTFILQALANPAVGMSLTADGRENWRLPAGGNMEARIRDLFGGELLRQLRPVAHEAAGVKVTGFAGLPSAGRVDRTEQYVTINGRATSANVISYAVKEGYHTLLPADRHPVIFLFIEVAPDQVDVNVHPTKREVRFRQPGAVRDVVIQAVRKALELPAMDATARRETAAPVFEGRQPPSVQMGIEGLGSPRAFIYPHGAAMWPPSTSTPATQTAAGSPGQPPAGAAEPPGATETSTPAGVDTKPGPWMWCRIIGQVGGLYVLLETDDGYVVMDPHAAHERVLFDRYLTALQNRTVESQPLLVSETVELMPRDALRIRQNLEIFQEMGFGISEFGGDTFVVEAMPACFGAIGAKDLLIEIAAHLEMAGSRGGRTRWREDAVAQAACKTAVKARDRLRIEEMEQLIADLAATSLPYTCPHGRPTMIYTSFQDLNRKFGRP